jgi:hypothetical protein
VHPPLEALIRRFRRAQDRGVAFVIDVLGPAFGVRLPDSGWDWAIFCGETGLHNVRETNGVGVYTHGYGIELIFDDVTIDFDWGDAGEPDGFDVWRLYNFARLNPSEVPSPEHDEVRAWVEAAAAAGELFRDGSLYYSPAHRTGLKRADGSPLWRG